MKCSLCSKATIGAKTRDSLLFSLVKRPFVVRRALYLLIIFISDHPGLTKLVIIEEVTFLAGKERLN